MLLQLLLNAENYLSFSLGRTNRFPSGKQCVIIHMKMSLSIDGYMKPSNTIERVAMEYGVGSLILMLEACLQNISFYGHV